MYTVFQVCSAESSEGGFLFLLGALLFFLHSAFPFLHSAFPVQVSTSIFSLIVSQRAILFCSDAAFISVS